VISPLLANIYLHMLDKALSADSTGWPRQTHLTTAEVMAQLNPVIRGWGNTLEPA
jgi:hypothetical protein